MAKKPTKDDIIKALNQNMGMGKPPKQKPVKK